MLIRTPPFFFLIVRFVCVCVLVVVVVVVYLVLFNFLMIGWLDLLFGRNETELIV